MGPCLYKYDIFLNGSKVGTQESMKILGVTLDKMFTFNDHISGQLKKAYAKSGALGSIRRFVPAGVYNKSLQFFCFPHLEYCSPLLLGVVKVQASRLEDANFLHFEIYFRLR